MESHTKRHLVGPRKIICVEHPCIVKNVDKAIATLGGRQGIAQLIHSEKPNQEIDLKLRPDDLVASPIPSANLSTDNLLIKITVPKLTGRKRKRGSQEPYIDASSKEQFSASPSENIKSYQRSSHTFDTRGPESLLTRLRQAADQYGISVIGTIDTTHRFRAMPDFVFSTKHQSFMQRLRESILPMNYESAKRFSFKPDKGSKARVDLLPPPQMSHFQIPFNYSYHQNPAVRQMIGESGEVKVKNDQMAIKIRTERLHYADAVPKGPHSTLPPLESLGPQMRTLINEMKSLFEQRPIWTRRALLNELKGQELKNAARHTYQYLGYTFKSGPWRDAIIKYGIDPRSDPQYRKYQTMMFQFDGDGKQIQKVEKRLRGGKRESGNVRAKADGGLGNRSHKFDGKHVGFDGRIWQVCDISDPLLFSLLDTSNIRAECDARSDGWYQNGTWAKARVIAKAKMAALKNERKVMRDFEFSKLLAIPDVIDNETAAEAVMSRKSTGAEIDMASTIRHLARSKGRHSSHRSHISKVFDAEGKQTSTATHVAESGSGEEVDSDSDEDYDSE